MSKPRTKKFEVKLQYTGTLTYIVRATDHKAAEAKGIALYDKGAEPDNLMTDWEKVDKITVESK